MTLVVMPDECQSMPMTAPNDWNQNGCDSRCKIRRGRSGGRSPE